MGKENEKDEAQFEPLFPELPEDGLSSLSDEELSALLDEHQSAVELITAEDEKFVGDLDGPQVLAELERGVEQIETIRAEQDARVEATEAYEAKKAELAARALGADEEEAEVVAEGDDDSEDEEDGEEEAEVVAEAEAITEEAAAEEAAPAPVVAAAQTPMPRVRRRVPAPSRDRQPIEDNSNRTVLVAASGMDDTRAGTELDRIGLAKAMINEVKRKARPHKHENGSEEKVLIASADYAFPPERILRANDPDGNTEKLRNLRVGAPWYGSTQDNTALVASGGLCAPLTPFYDIPDFAVTDRPVRAALPSFQADRGGVSVPSVSTIGSITSAISFITEEEDAMGGTFAEKSCQDMECPTWTDVAVNIIAHCREYGNLNARAWPEGIAHENNLTMAAHSRTAETALLDRIKALSINVTTAQTYNSAFELLYAVNRAAAGIRFRLRLNRTVALRALLPEWILNLLAAEAFAYQYHDRNVGPGDVTSWFRNANVVPAFYLDNVTGGTSQGFSDETASALDDFPDAVQWALFVEGEFLHLDGGVLELGIVRDSTLNSTNDYQVFGETFENVARIGPTQGALWVTSTICPNGVFPALGTALSCA